MFLKIFTFVVLLVGCQNPAADSQSNVQAFFANSVRRTATPDEAAHVVKVRDGHCTAYFVANTQGKTYLGSASHCFDFDATNWCATDGTLTDNAGKNGRCTRIVASQPERDLVFFEANLPYVPTASQSLRLASYVPKIGMPLKMIGYPGDVQRQGALTVTENCVVQSDTVASPYTTHGPSGEGGHVLTDPSSRHNCSTYGGNSGGPMLLNGTADVIGLPYTFNPDNVAHPGNDAIDWEYLAQMAGFVADNRATLSAAGIVIDDTQPTPAAPQGAPLTAAETGFVSQCTRTDLPPAAAQTLTAIAQEFGTTDCPTLAQDFTQATEIILSGSAVQDLSFFQFAVNVQGLYLQSTSLSDLTPLASLCPQLRLLDLSGNGSVQDISPLAGCKRLATLNLNGTGIKDLAPILKLPLLTELSLDNTVLNTSATLQGMTLWRLSLNNVKNANVQGMITSLTLPSALTELALEGDGLSDLTTILALPAFLSSLDLANNAVTDVTPIAKLTHLNQLNLAGNQITNVVPLAGLTGLQALVLQNNQITNVSPLSALGGLLYLGLGGNPLPRQACPVTPAGVCDFTASPH